MEAIIDVRTLFVTDREAPHLVEPRDASLDYPAVPAQPLGRLNTRTCDAALDPTRPQDPLVLPGAVPLAGMQLLGSLPRSSSPAAHRRHGIEEALQHSGLVDVCRRGQLRERDALPVSDQVALPRRLRTMARKGSFLMLLPSLMVSPARTGRAEKRRPATAA